jgi:hypothetical protein
MKKDHVLLTHSDRHLVGEQFDLEGTHGGLNSSKL